MHIIQEIVVKANETGIKMREIVLEVNYVVRAESGVGSTYEQPNQQQFSIYEEGRHKVPRWLKGDNLEDL